MAHLASVLPPAPAHPADDPPTETEQATGGDATLPVSVHDLVEDVSIDGMCGVY
jgi:mycofactocin precursor